ncbi:MAG: hypothetical protein Q8R92_04510 [Deltaproteobacteria bacterium]|nr:hypothetical protein [Deltaproteobacteria bacterium]
MTARAAAGGGISVDFNFTNSAKIAGVVPNPDINGSLTFTPDANGSYTMSGSITRFPAHAAYVMRGGQWQLIGTPHGGSSPIDLFDFRKPLKYP